MSWSWRQRSKITVSRIFVISKIWPRTRIKWRWLLKMKRWCRFTWGNVDKSTTSCNHKGDTNDNKTNDSQFLKILTFQNYFIIIWRLDAIIVIWTRITINFFQLDIIDISVFFFKFCEIPLQETNGNCIVQSSKTVAICYYNKKIALNIVIMKLN